MLPFLLGSAVCFLASYFSARILLIRNSGFGAGDLSAFVFWSILFSIFLLLPAVLYSLLQGPARTVSGVWLGVLLGGFVGLGWTLLNRWFLGPWFGAWSFNVLYCWIAGGASGLLTVGLLGRRQSPLP